MSALAPYAQGFLGELEKLAAKATKETRKGWLSSKSRKGTRPMRVSTMLRKEKEGTLGGYKLAHVLEAMSKIGGPAVHHPAKEHPSRDDTHGDSPKREDGRGNAAVIHAPSSETSAPGE